jgi:hypothetical protein
VWRIVDSSHICRCLYSISFTSLFCSIWISWLFQTTYDLLLFFLNKLYRLIHQCFQNLIFLLWVVNQIIYLVIYRFYSFVILLEWFEFYFELNELFYYFLHLLVQVLVFAIVRGSTVISVVDLMVSNSSSNCWCW